ncbi:hypothetical protein BDZ85DRAFT_295693 [Elsinoe ampelina]|uniref:Uncharacterized protein n=1 Tax=Elsinoe ampelina TaxID=302913 RepID=A0A6A6GCP6_9PEZI|nr:hypothetical protein BDZ85DRAFT_295693 [Elsinoe ampelina]
MVMCYSTGWQRNATYMLSFKDGKETISQLAANPNINALYGITEINEDVFIVSVRLSKPGENFPAPGTSAHLSKWDGVGQSTDLVVNATNFESPSATHFGRMKEDRNTLYIATLGGIRDWQWFSWEIVCLSLTRRKRLNGDIGTGANGVDM